MVLAMRHGVFFYEAMGLFFRFVGFGFGVSFYEATRGEYSLLKNFLPIP
jgi:hypothetical protein